MNQLTINIAYWVDNQHVVGLLVQQLKPTNVQFNLIDGNNFVKQESFYDHLVDSENPCLLFVSDNFLKSTSSLNRGLPYLHALVKKEQVIPIIIDGTTIGEAGERVAVPTQFQKVSDVIKYMNYWQEKYLEMRKLRKNIPAEEKAAFTTEMKTVFEISTEVGEYLRSLRETNYYTLEEFSNNSYEAFFNNFGTPAAHQAFLSQAQHQSDTTPEKVSSEPTPAVAMEEASPSPAFFPIEDLIIEKEKLANGPNDSSEPDLKLVDEVKEDDQESETEEVQTNLNLKEQLVEVAEEQDLAKNTEEHSNEDDQFGLKGTDPEWDEIQEEEPNKISSEEPVDAVGTISDSEEGELTETELLAIELALKLPKKEENALSLMGAEVDGTSEEEEEMISLEDLLGEDFSMDLNAKKMASLTNEEASIQEAVDNDSIDLREITEEEDGIVVEDEDELEGYFMDEGEETEEIIEEVSEFEVLQSANTLVQSGKTEEGMSLLKATLEEAPEFVSVRYQFAAYLALYQNDFKQASNQLELLLEHEPNNISALFFLGELAEAERDYLSAKSYFEKVYAINPEFPNAAYRIGNLMVNHLEENRGEAAKLFQTAYQQNNNNVKALYQLGLLQNEHLGEPEKAIESFEKVLQAAPEHPFANYDLALIYHRKGKPATAIQFYEQAALINPELKTIVNDQAFALEMESQRDALEAVSESVEITQEVETVGAIAASKQIIKPLATNIESNQEEIVKVNPEIDKVVLITGATAGIGKATARKFAEAGYNLIITGRRHARLFHLKEELEDAYNIKVKILSFDLTNIAAAKSALENLEEEWRDIDLLINNAGMARGQTPIHEGDFSHWERMIDTNIKGLLYMTRQVVPNMVERRTGQIINVCSLAGKEVYPNNAVYCATKHAVDALTKAMRLDLHKYNIRVSQVSPGFVEDTEFAKVKKTGTAEGEDLPFNDFVPVNAKDIAAVIYFIANQPKHVTLQEVVLAGTQQASANFINRSGR